MALSAAPDLVIFDCDGVLVDSEPLAAAVTVLGLKDLGLTLTESEVRAKFTGLSWASVSSMIEEMIGRPIPDGWHQTMRQYEHEQFRQHLKPVPFVRDVVDVIRERQIRYCVASSGAIEKMHLTLGITDMLPLFEDVLFSSSMVDRGKPHPDLFLFAADQMGVDPTRCVVLEDSVAGATGAVAAGMTVLSYTGDPLADHQGLAAAGGVLFDDMRQVPEMIGLGPS